MANKVMVAPPSPGAQSRSPSWPGRPVRLARPHVPSAAARPSTTRWQRGVHLPHLPEVPPDAAAVAVRPAQDGRRRDPEPALVPPVPLGRRNRQGKVEGAHRGGGVRSSCGPSAPRRRRRPRPPGRAARRARWPAGRSDRGRAGGRARPLIAQAAALATAGPPGPSGHQDPRALRQAARRRPRRRPRSPGRQRACGQPVSTQACSRRRATLHRAA